MTESDELPTVEEVRGMSRSDVMQIDRAVGEDREYSVNWLDPHSPDREGYATFSRLMTDEEWAAREGAGETCAGCGNKIGKKAIIVNDKRGDGPTESYHYGCYVDED